MAAPALPAMDAPIADPRGVGIMVSYKELVEIRTQMATMMAMLQAALALQGKVDIMDHRLQKVELFLAGKAGAQKSWNTMLGFVAGVVTAGAVAWFPALLALFNTAGH